MATLGFLVNPIAGMGGAVGLKGTDGAMTLREAHRRGAKPVSPERGREFLSEILSRRGAVKLLVAGGIMGAELAKGVGLDFDSAGRVGRKTSAEDTVRISRFMKRMGVDLLVFCGGDGTARDVLRAVGDDTPVLGVPAGVKVYSSVFAVNPRAAAESALRFLAGELPTKLGEVLDIDEKAYREDRLSIRLVGYLLTPDAGFLIQESKSPTRLIESVELDAIADYVKEEMRPDLVYVLGPGTTVERVGRQLGVKKTLLGVDVVKGDGTVLAQDVGEAQLLPLVKEGSTKVIISPIGGQGFLFGRGNQQISPRVLRKIGTENVVIVASKSKIESLNPRRLLVDSGDARVDRKLRGYRRVITGYREEMVLKVE